MTRPRPTTHYRFICIFYNVHLDLLTLIYTKVFFFLSGRSSFRWKVGICLVIQCHSCCLCNICSSEESNDASQIFSHNPFNFRVWSSVGWSVHERIRPLGVLLYKKSCSDFPGFSNGCSLLYIFHYMYPDARIFHVFWLAIIEGLESQET